MKGEIFKAICAALLVIAIGGGRLIWLLAKYILPVIMVGIILLLGLKYGVLLGNDKKKVEGGNS